MLHDYNTKNNTNANIDIIRGSQGQWQWWATTIKRTQQHRAMASLHENTKITKTENTTQNLNPKLELKTFNPRLELELSKN